MVPPKYKFYAGYSAGATFVEGVSINDNGDFISMSSAYAAGKNPLPDTGATHMYIDLTSTDAYNAIFFYGAGGALIGVYKALVDWNGKAIPVPTGAKSYGIRFSKNDTNFKKDPTADIVYFTREIAPHYKTLSKKYEKESGQQFLRASLDGKVSLFGSDYDFIKAADIESRFLLFIYKYNETSQDWPEYYRGQFVKTDCKFDFSKKKCELSVTALDAYNKVLDAYENTYDLIKLAPALTSVTAYQRMALQIYVLGGSTISNYFAGTYQELEVNEAVDSADDLVNKYCFAWLKSVNEVYIKDCPDTEINRMYAGSGDGRWDDAIPFFYLKLETEVSKNDEVPGSVAPTVYDINSGSSRTARHYKDASGYVRYGEDLYRLNLYHQYSPGTPIYQSDYLLYSSDGNMLIDGGSEIAMNNGSGSALTVYNGVSYQVYQRLLCNMDEIYAWDGTKSTYPIPSDDFAISEENRNLKRCIGCTMGGVVYTARTVTEPTKFGINDDGQYFTNQFIPTSSGVMTPQPVCRSSWANVSLWFIYDDGIYDFYDRNTRVSYKLKDCYHIGDAIAALLKEIDPSLTHKCTEEYSQFLYADTKPGAFSSVFPRRMKCCITQKSNLLKGDYDQAAQKAETTLKDIMEMLRDCFRCYWYIEDGKFKIEHISFFLNGGSYTEQQYQFDFTALTDPFNRKPLAYCQTEIEYDKSELKSRYEFNWMDDVTDNFGNMAIDVKSNYTQQDENEEINISQFTPDVDFMLLNPADFSDDGFALLCPIKDSITSDLALPIVSLERMDEYGTKSTAQVQNAYASWLNLAKAYMYDMPAYGIECDATDALSVYGVKRCMTHTIEFASGDDPDGVRLIKTGVGTGLVEGMSINISTRLVSADLSYKPE